MPLICSVASVRANKLGPKSREKEGAIKSKLSQIWQAGQPAHLKTILDTLPSTAYIHAAAGQSVACICFLLSSLHAHGSLRPHKPDRPVILPVMQPLPAAVFFASAAAANPQHPGDPTVLNLQLPQTGPSRPAVLLGLELLKSPTKMSQTDSAPSQTAAAAAGCGPNDRRSCPARTSLLSPTMVTMVVLQTQYGRLLLLLLPLLCQVQPQPLQHAHACTPIQPR